MASGGNSGGTWALILLALFVGVFLLPSLCGGYLLGIESSDIISSPWGWLCSLFFWLALIGGAFLFKSISGCDD